MSASFAEPGNAAGARSAGVALPSVILSQRPSGLMAGLEALPFSVSMRHPGTSAGAPPDRSTRTCTTAPRPSATPQPMTYTLPSGAMPTVLSVYPAPAPPKMASRASPSP